MKMSQSSVSTCLKHNNIVYEAPKSKKPYLNSEDAKVRLHFAYKYLLMPIAFWMRIIFTDET